MSSDAHNTAAHVVAVSRSSSHTMSKSNTDTIRLLTDLGVEGDAHLGRTVKHRSRVARDPTQPNLRQVHLIHTELFDELRAKGFVIVAGQMGENISTRGLDLLALPAGTRLHIGDTAIVSITGLRNPCTQLNGIAPGLMAALLARADASAPDAASPDAASATPGALVRKAGVMGVVVAWGDVRAGANIRIELPHGAHVPLAVV